MRRQYQSLIALAANAKPYRFKQPKRIIEKRTGARVVCPPDIDERPSRVIIEIRA